MRYAGNQTPFKVCGWVCIYENIVFISQPILRRSVVLLSSYYGRHLQTALHVLKHITGQQNEGVNRCSPFISIRSWCLGNVSPEHGSSHFQSRWFIQFVHTIIIRDVFYFPKLKNSAKIKFSSSLSIPRHDNTPTCCALFGSAGGGLWRWLRSCDDLRLCHLIPKFSTNSRQLLYRQLIRSLIISEIAIDEVLREPRFAFVWVTHLLYTH